MNNQDTYPYLVSVKCFTYNHAHFIEDAVRGFCIQETNFPFVCTIIDDASTDGEQDVLNKYLQEYFDMEDKSTVRKEETDDYVMTFARHKTNFNCYFAVFYLKYNHYSIKKAKNPYLAEWQDKCKYIALCEGDDYWIDPLKLQKQVDYMEAHPDNTMVCNRTKLYSEKRQQFVGENYCYKRSQLVDAKDIICRQGLYISTCSIMYRPEIKNNYPDYCKQCKVGDYPLQIMAAMKGKVYFFNEAMSVYRRGNKNSWMGTQGWKSASKARLEVIRSTVNMLYGFAGEYSQYAKVFNYKVAEFINRNVPDRRYPKSERLKYSSFFTEDIKRFSFMWKVDYRIRCCRIPLIRYYYDKFFFKNYKIRFMAT